LPLIQLDVFFGKILADNADQFDRRKKTRGHGGVAGRAAQQTRIFGFRGLDGIEGGGADNEYAHLGDGVVVGF